MGKLWEELKADIEFPFLERPYTFHQLEDNIWNTFLLLRNMDCYIEDIGIRK
jgi:hypothetical protein